MKSNRSGGISAMMQTGILPNIGLDFNARQSVVEILNNILADESMLAQKTCNAYWNIIGPNFFELHTLFGAQYKQLIRSSNNIAERVRMLGGFAIGSFREFLLYSRLEDRAGEVPDIVHLLADHEATIRHLREDARKCSEEYEDEGTFEFLGSVMRLHEKMGWMLRSFMETQPVHEAEKSS
jgi:starvation-inducible DNA-binding protein